jgi:hypothetical protein
VRTSETTLLFLHIPKAAGTTLARIAERHIPPRKQYRLGANAQAAIERFNRMDEKERKRFRYIAGHFPYGVHEQVPGPSAYLTMLRDPVERVISFYHFIRSNPRHPWHEILPDSLSDFAENCHIPVFDNGQTRLLAGDWGRIPFGECNQALLETAKRNLDAMDVVGLSEAFPPSVLLAARRFGWKRLGYLSENRNLDRPREAPNPETRKLLSEWNHLDLKLYAYAKARFEQDVAALGDSFTREIEEFEQHHPPPGSLRQFMDKVGSRTPWQWATALGDRLTR